MADVPADAWITSLNGWLKDGEMLGRITFMPSAGEGAHGHPVYGTEVTESIGSDAEFVRLAQQMKRQYRKARKAGQA